MLSANVMFIICETDISSSFLVDDLIFSIFFISNKVRHKADLKTVRSGRRRWIKKVEGNYYAIAFAQFLHGITKGKYAYTVENKVLTFPNLPTAFDGFKILHFSDFHVLRLF